MGLFGTTPLKKLEKARTLAAQGRHYEARRLFEELVDPGSRLAGTDRMQAEAGWRAVRRDMIALRLTEAEALRLAGDLEGARDRCQTALDLAGGDLETDAIQEEIRRIDAPHRPLTPSGDLKPPVETDLLPDPDETTSLRPTPLDRPRPETPPKSDEELFGEDPEALFDVYMNTLDPSTAELYRSLGPDFRLGYLALVQGEGRRALHFFDRLDWSRPQDARLLLERAHALLLADQGQEALTALEEVARSLGEPQAGAPDSKAPAPEDSQAGRRLFLRVEALRLLGRLDEAVAAARELADRAAPPTPTTEALLAWTLLEAGHTQEAYDRLRVWLRQPDPSEEILIPAAQAAVALDKQSEAIDLLEAFIERRMHRSVVLESELDFPVEAGRRLLDLYLDTGKEPGALRALVLHLIDQDPERGERYRDLILQLNRV